MPSAFLLTVRFLDPVPEFHGRGDGGGPEWPPSPLRLFQALVCAAAGHWRDGQLADYAFPALRWLEQQREPSIVAPDIQPERTGFRMYVPNNAGDLVTAAWARGNYDAKFSSLNVEKDVLPTRIVGGDSIHYVWELPNAVTDEVRGYLETIAACARSITHLGWGVDMVAANAKVVEGTDAAASKGHIWTPMPTGGTPLRVTREGTLKALQDRHGRFLTRLSGEAFSPVPPLSTFHTVGYHCPTAPSSKPAAARPFAAFSILNPDASGFRPYDTVRRFATVAGMVRFAAAEVTESSGWTKEKIASFIQGHGAEKNGQATTDDRLMFLPLPSITPMGVESIRRVLVVGPPGRESDIVRIRQLLNGAELKDKDSKQIVAMLSLIPQSDRNVKQYTGESRVWSTVTPVMLPGFDDPDGIRKRLKNEKNMADVQRRLLEQIDSRVMALLHKAFEHAGLPRELVQTAGIEYRSVGFRAGVDLASQYSLPPLHYPRFHVRVTFAHAVRGPLAVGAGRYRGLGLFAVEENDRVPSTGVADRV